MSKVVLSAAGAGKTSRIIKFLANTNNHVLVTTFTDNNAEEIRARIWRRCPEAIPRTTVLPWYTFLLRDLCLPYQNVLIEEPWANGVHLANGQSASWQRRGSRHFYLDPAHRIYNDKLAYFALDAMERSQNASLERLRKLYDLVIIDEVQDIAGPDLDLVECLLRNIPMVMVGDVRQATLRTNNGKKHSRYRGAEVLKVFEAWETQRLCRIERNPQSYRCPQSICDLADSLFPAADLGTTESRQPTRSAHTGVFRVSHQLASRYQAALEAQVLRHSVNTACFDPNAMNMGASKGLEFRHVMIHPTGPIQRWLRTADVSDLKPSAVTKLYVAVTRARHSVAFISDEPSPLGLRDVTPELLEEIEGLTPDEVNPPWPSMSLKP